MKQEPDLGWIRKVRNEISTECNHDPEKLVDYIVKLEKRHKNRLVKFEEPSQKKASL